MRQTNQPIIKGGGAFSIKHLEDHALYSIGWLGTSVTQRNLPKLPVQPFFPSVSRLEPWYLQCARAAERFKTSLGKFLFVLWKSSCLWNKWRRRNEQRMQHALHVNLSWTLSLLAHSVFCTVFLSYLTLILRRSRTGTVWFYTSTSNKRAARSKLYTKSLTRDLKLMYSCLTLVRISINL